MSEKHTKERPILFSAPMVRALLDGRKTQTRRVVKSIGKDEGFVVCERDDETWWPHRSDDGERCWHTVKRGGHEYQDDTPHSCPYGAPGDLLWVRETWSKARSCNCSDIFYRADGETSGRQTAFSFIERESRWRPSIHMPRWASRITLEVTGVRVERLQEIS
jgi:hypothetical protein